jgi:hypothetical protein
MNRGCSSRSAVCNRIVYFKNHLSQLYSNTKVSTYSIEKVVSIEIQFFFLNFVLSLRLTHYLITFTLITAHVLKESKNTRKEDAEDLVFQVYHPLIK